MCSMACGRQTVLYMSGGCSRVVAADRAGPTSGERFGTIGVESHVANQSVDGAPREMEAPPRDAMISKAWAGVPAL
jgi:hypothetical protein